MDKKEIIELLEKNNIEVSDCNINFFEKLLILDDDQLNLVEEMINDKLCKNKKY
ncbi:hypothetical protein [Clostridium botulinum]|uniref:hypothetical protein n=1 Tax=Clostridium botulinum TaxID=1491 RepID=UPI000ABDEF09|nr:hypothetical protein [Clostridium botulinum]